jgi:hypothetical protein
MNRYKVQIVKINFTIRGFDLILNLFREKGGMILGIPHRVRETYTFIG